MCCNKSSIILIICTLQFDSFSVLLTVSISKVATSVVCLRQKAILIKFCYYRLQLVLILIMLILILLLKYLVLSEPKGLDMITMASEYQEAHLYSFRDFKSQQLFLLPEYFLLVALMLRKYPMMSF